MKKIFSVLLIFIMSFTFASCVKSNNSRIYMISREEGSGTRGAFAEIFGVLDENGIDDISGRAEKVTSNATVISTVIGNKNAIGYVSIGSVNSSVRVVSIDGVFPSAENIQEGEYKIVRPFNICYKDDSVGDIAIDFIKFIDSVQGQKIISEKGYIPSCDHAAEYKSKVISGKITLAGSTSVSPVMEKLADEYKKMNPHVEIEVQQSGSGAGIQAVIAGACDIGMSSRDLKSGELEILTSHKIANDGIAVIVNKQNEVSDLDSKDVKNIYLGNIKDWSELVE